MCVGSEIMTNAVVNAPIKMIETRTHKAMSLNISIIMMTNRPIVCDNWRYLKRRHQMSKTENARISTESVSEKSVLSASRRSCKASGNHTYSKSRPGRSRAPARICTTRRELTRSSRSTSPRQVRTLSEPPPSWKSSIGSSTKMSPPPSTSDASESRAHPVARLTQP